MGRAGKQLPGQGGGCGRGAVQVLDAAAGALGLPSGSLQRAQGEAREGAAAVAGREGGAQKEGRRRHRLMRHEAEFDDLFQLLFPLAPSKLEGNRWRQDRMRPRFFPGEQAGMASGL